MGQLTPPGRTVIDLEGYCLAAILKKPEMLPLINRKFAQLANERDALLGPLTPGDFERSEYKAVLSIFMESLEQFELDPLDYLYQNLPIELSEELDRLFHEDWVGVNGWAERELQSVAKDKLRLRSVVVVREEDEFIERALELRKKRINRESTELGFLQYDNNEDFSLMRQVHRHKVIVHQIDVEIRRLKQAHQ